MRAVLGVFHCVVELVWHIFNLLECVTGLLHAVVVCCLWIRGLVHSPCNAYLAPYYLQTVQCDSVDFSYVISYMVLFM